MTERHCLCAAAPDGPIGADVHHHPWPLQKAHATIHENSILDFHGIEVREPPSLLHFARHIDVVVWNGERVA